MLFSTLDKVKEGAVSNRSPDSSLTTENLYAVLEPQLSLTSYEGVRRLIPLADASGYLSEQLRNIKTR